MPGTLCITWTITSSASPMPILPCARCNTQRAFASSGRFRLNANGKRLDAWLIYRCTVCDQTRNRTIFERRARNTVDPALLGALQRNDPELVLKTALDTTGIKRWKPGGDHGLSVAKAVASTCKADAVLLEITMRMPSPVPGIRCDKLLALGLGVSRSAVGKLARGGRLAFEPGAAATALARPVRDGQQVWLTLDGLGNAALLRAAASGQADTPMSAASAPVN